MAEYLTDVVYPVAFRSPLNVVMLRYLAAEAGLSLPSAAEPFTYLDLGCGSAMTLLYEAAAAPRSRFFGVDLSAEMIGQGRRLAETAGLGNVTLFEAPFGAVPDLPIPPVDFLVMHGIYSWVGEAVRGQVRDVIRARLKPGGIVLLNYNCRPGGLIGLELCRLARFAAPSSEGGNAARVELALDFLVRLRRSGARLFAQTEASDCLDRWLGADRAYLAHELFAQDQWVPDVATVAAEMQSIGLAYLADMEAALNMPELAVPPDLGELLRSRTDRANRATLVDFVAARRFRGELYVRGTAPPLDGPPCLDGFLFGLAGEPSTFRYEHAFPSGHWTAGRLSRAIVAALKDGPLPLARLADRCAPGADPAELIRSLRILVATRQVVPLAAPWPATVEEPPHQRLNRIILAMALARQRQLPLASGFGRPFVISEGALLMLAAVADAGYDGAVARGREAVGDGTLTVAGRPVGGAELQRVLGEGLIVLRRTTVPRLARLGVLPPDLLAAFGLDPTPSTSA